MPSLLSTLQSQESPLMASTVLQLPAAVSEFQSIFGLPQTGVVDFRTWYKISHIYVGITRIAELT